MSLLTMIGFDSLRTRGMIRKSFIIAGGPLCYTSMDYKAWQAEMVVVGANVNLLGEQYDQKVCSCPLFFFLFQATLY